MSINKFENELVLSTKIYKASFEVGEKQVKALVRVIDDGEYDIEWEFEVLAGIVKYTDEEIDEIDNFINNNY